MERNVKPPLVALIERICKMLSDEFARHLKENHLDISTVEFVILFNLSQMANDEVNQQDFANILGKDKSVIFRQIDTLEQKKYVARIADAKDRRKNLLVLTKTGSTILAQALKIESDMMRSIALNIEYSELDTAEKAISQLQENLTAKLMVRNRMM
jgi:DNA-binding MarR family transcriptional regulator